MDGTFAKLVQAGFCHLQWLRDLPTVLAPALNVFVETGDGKPPMAFYYPDGLMLTLLLPVAFEHLDVCPVLMGHLDEEPRFSLPCWPNFSWAGAWSTTSKVVRRT